MLPCFNLVAQDTLFYTIEQGESLYKLHKIFEVSLPDIKQLNNLDSEILMPGQIVKIYNENPISKNKIALNTLVYSKELLEKDKQNNNTYLETRLDSLSKYSITLTKDSEIQEKFKVAKRKAFIKDSINVVNEKLTNEIIELGSAIKKIALENTKNEAIETEKIVAKDSTKKIKAAEEEEEETLEKPVRLSAEERETIRKAKEKAKKHAAKQKAKAKKEKEKSKKIAAKAKEKEKKDKAITKKKKKKATKIKEKAKKEKLQKKEKAKKIKEIAKKNPEKANKIKQKEILDAANKILKEKELALKKAQKIEAKTAKAEQISKNKLEKKEQNLAKEKQQAANAEKEKEAIAKKETSLKAKQEKEDKQAKKEQETNEVSSAVIINGKKHDEKPQQKKQQKPKLDFEKQDEIVIRKDSAVTVLNIDSLKKLKTENNVYLEKSLKNISLEIYTLDLEKDIQKILALSKDKYLLADSINKLNAEIDKYLPNKPEIKKIKESSKEEILDFDNTTKIDTSTISKEKKEKFEQEEKEIETLQNEIIVDAEVKKEVKLKAVTIKKDKKKIKYKIGDEVEKQLQEKARFFLSRAKLEIDKSNISKAREYLDKSIQLNPSLAAAYVLKGDIYSSMSFYEKAVNQYKRASFLKPKDAQLNYNIGNCFIRMGKEDLAIAEWSKAIKNDATYILAYAGRASLLMKAKKYEEAIEDYDKIFSINKFFYMAYKGRGVAHLELGNYGKAIIDFNNFLAYEPEDDFVIMKRGLAKLSDNEIYGGCIDLLSASEYGNKIAEKALRKHCEK